MSMRAARLSRQDNRPCPDCDRSMIVHDRCRDICPRCGVIVGNERRTYRLMVRTFGGHLIYRRGE